MLAAIEHVCASANIGGNDFIRNGIALAAASSFVSGPGHAESDSHAMTNSAYGTSPNAETVSAINGTGSNDRCFEGMLNELACAEAMAGLAIIAIDFENFRRTYNNARQCYEAAVSQLLQLHLSAERIPEINSRLDQLRSWLDIVGPRFHPVVSDASSGRHEVEM
jgi:hypothetical protein